MCDTSTQEKEWIPIFSMWNGNNYDARYTLSIEIYQGDLWLFGYVLTPENQTVGAARWNSDENSWEYMYTSLTTGEHPERSLISVSPDGNNAFFVPYVYGFTFTHVYQWNDTTGNWTLIYSTWCNDVPQIVAIDTGVLVACDGQILQLPEETWLPIHCPDVWNSFSISPDGTHLNAFCELTVNNTLQVLSYDLATQTVGNSTDVTDFEKMIFQLYSLCSYGDKLVASGVFEKIGGISAPNFAVWDSQYQKWYQVSDQLMSTCACGAEGTQMATVCIPYEAHPTPLLVLANATSDSGSGEMLQNTLQYTLSNISGTVYVQQTDIIDGVVYFSTYNGQNIMGFNRWSQQDGSEVIFTCYGSYFFFSIANSTAYITGFFGFSNNYTEAITAARFDLTSKIWYSMDQVEEVVNNKTERGDIYTSDYSAISDQIYVGGRFNRIGTLKVRNLGGYDKEGVAADSMAGGLQNTVAELKSAGSRVYLITRADGCSQFEALHCGTLLSYDVETQTYSNMLAEQVATMAIGTTMDETSGSSSNTTMEFAWKTLVIIFAVAMTVIVIIIVAFVIVRKMRATRRFYQEIPEVVSENSVGPIDFQHDNFVMKSVLGRGAYGTVWSCVFPHKELGTYAVKQMLYSTGETKKIEVVKQEIDILEKFRHPHIVHYCGHRVETTQTSVEFFIFMELYEQPCSLKGVIQKKTKGSQKQNKPNWFTYEEIKRFLIQISDGLHYLHIKGVAHRDLKCANILVRMKGPVVNTLHIADFGIARVMNAEEGAANVLASTVLGTPSFMAPEILHNQKYDAFKADIWSFGMMLYEMLSFKEPPIPGIKPQFPEEVAEFMKLEPQFEGVLEIFDKCTQQEPSSRPTASDLLYLCENLL